MLIRTRAAVSVTAVLAAGLALTLAQPSDAASRSSSRGATLRVASIGAGVPQPGQRGAVADFDIRRGGTASGTAALERRSASIAAGRPVTALRASLGDQGLVSIDGLTGTPRQVARLDGLLTAPSTLAPAAVALGYVRAHADVFRLSPAVLAGLVLRRDYVDIAGIHHLSWIQKVGGTTVFGNGLQAAVTGNGALVSVTGSPLADLAIPSATGRAVVVGSAARALSAARIDLGDTASSPGQGDLAAAVLFDTPSGLRRAWATVTMSATEPAQHVIDEQTGRVLYRRSLGSHAAAPNDSTAVGAAAQPRPAATALAFDYYPGAPAGGVTKPVDLTASGWLPATATILSGNNAHAYSDVNDNNLPSVNEEVAPRSNTASGPSWAYRLQPIDAPYSFCGNPLPCTWNPDKPYSWRTNRAQNTTQVFVFVNRWHDHLEAAPIGFTEDAGNFQVVNRSGSGVGGDPVLTETEDGAATDRGLPDSSHIDNANMATPPDGQSPRMQMYLQHAPFATYPGDDPFAPTDVGDEADTVYHEYTHGLSNRLVVDASGNSGLFEGQSGAMGEAWSDWYAMDDLVARKLQPDTSAPGEIVLFQFDGAGTALDRTEPIDCSVGAPASVCPGTRGAGSGGYTYGDFGHVFGSPEVHADGEIWAQTLWDLRGVLGSRLTESLVTRAMELTPVNPSYLDERNAILQADTAIYGGRDRAAIWKVFAHRGMGWFAAAVDGDDTSPSEDFSLPPAPGTPRATLTGRVSDANTGKPLEGATVEIGGHASGLPGAYSAVSDASGRYAMSGLFPGTYAKVSASAPGYDTVVAPVSVHSGTTYRGFSLVRDLAAASGGATVLSFTGVDNSSFGCGPSSAIDQTLGSGWASDSDLVEGKPGPLTAKTVVVALHQTVDVGTIAVDPGATCGDGASASTAGYLVELSKDGQTWQTAAEGVFTPAANGHLNRLTPRAGTGDGVAYLRFTMKGPQVFQLGLACPSSGASGCDYLDMSEIELYAPAS